MLAFARFLWQMRGRQRTLPGGYSLTAQLGFASGSTADRAAVGTSLQRQLARRATGSGSGWFQMLAPHQSFRLSVWRSEGHSQLVAHHERRDDGDGDRQLIRRGTGGA